MSNTTPQIEHPNKALVVSAGEGADQFTVSHTPLNTLQE
jgi:hypothetical protein